MNRDELIALAKHMLTHSKWADEIELARAFLEADAERERLREGLQTVGEDTRQNGELVEKQFARHQQTERALAAERDAARAALAVARDALEKIAGRGAGPLAHRLEAQDALARIAELSKGVPS